MKRRSALITGASSGIGAATAKYYASQGYFVYLLGRDEERLNQVALECPNGASLLKCDLNNNSQVDKYTQHLFQRPDTQLEVLVNNAGIFEPHSPLQDSMEVWHRQFNTNLFGSINLTMKLLPLLLQAKGAWIVNVSSGLGLKPSARNAAYSAAKAAMISWTKSLAQELGQHQVRVNCVAPGLVITPIHGYKTENEKEKLSEQMKGYQPLGRVGTPEEIARSIYFLGSEESRWTTGAVLVVDGGINLP
jgi:NAD(P)-dependent dehydrogenase (short-subunit alcohol dehydrogenase family)